MKSWVRLILLIAIVGGGLGPITNPQTALAAKGGFGYLWKAVWDFEKNFNGVLTIEYGHWKNGELIDVLETSHTKILCKPVGSVSLDSGDAVFEGGYLKCSMHLAETVSNKHNLVIDPVDDYGSITVNATVYGAANTVAPLLTHPDAAYEIDYTLTSSVTPGQHLSNGAGPLQASFPGVTIFTWQSYTFRYDCIANGGPCDAAFGVGPQQQTLPTAGSRTQFATGPTAFTIGGHGGAVLSGRIEDITIDPGNSTH